MKIANLIARVLLGLLFFIFGSTTYCTSSPCPAHGDAGIYMTILATHKFFNFIGLLMIISGLLLLVGRFVPLALVILGPIIVNILMYHLLLEPTGIAPGAIAALLELFLIIVYRRSFFGLFDAAPEPV